MADYTRYTVTVPANPNLPDGGGQAVPVYNLNPDKLGAVDSVSTFSTSNTRVYNGFEFSGNGRLPGGGFVFGSVTVERSATNNCDVADPNELRFCDQVPPFRGLYKASTGYTLPYDVQLRGRADRHRQPTGKSEQPLAGAVDNSSHGSEPGRRLDSEMGVDDRTKFARHCETGHQVAGDHRGYRQDHAIVGAERDLLLPEIETGDPVLRQIECTQPVPKSHRHAAAGEKPQRRLDENRPEPGARDQRPTGPSADGQGLAHDGSGEAGAPLLRIGVEDGKKQWPHQPIVKRTRAGDQLANAFVAGSHQQPGESKIVGGRRTGNAAGLVEDPPRQPPGIDAQRPAFAVGDVDEREFGSGGAVQSAGGADRCEVAERGIIGGEKKVIAIVDHHVEGWIVI